MQHDKESSFTFGVIADIHLTNDGKNGTERPLGQVLRYYREQDIKALIVCGDIADEGGLASYERFNRIFSSVYPNHGSSCKDSGHGEPRLPGDEP